MRLGRKNLAWLKVILYAYFFIVSLIILALLTLKDNYYSHYSLPTTANSFIFQSSPTAFTPKALSWNLTKMAKFEMKFKNFRLDYEMTQPDADFCNTKIILVIIVTRADMEGYLFRRAIRKSWLQKARVPQSVAYRFIVGLPNDEDAGHISIDLLKWESNHFHDMIFTTIPDLYLNLFMKTQAILQWKVTYCPNAKVLLKIDDDTALSLERLNYWFQKEIYAKMREYPVMALCNVLKNKTPYREEWFRWYVPYDEFPESVFPEYCNGAIYMLTDEAVIQLLRRAHLVNKMRLEDVLFTGVLGQMANLTRFNTPAFSYDIITWECSDDKIPLQMAIFGLNYKDIETKHNELMTYINCSAHK